MAMSVRNFISKAARLAILPLAALLFGCGIQGASEPHPQRARSTDRFIYVTANGLPDNCYRYLGTVQLTEPFANAAVDADGSSAAAELRKLALEKYPADVDAVIHVKRAQNETGSSVSISGQAIELRRGESVACAMRKMPGILDASAATAAGGIVGTAAGGLLSGQPEGAMLGAALGASVVGANELTEAQQQAQFQRQAIKDRLTKQRREIVSLQAQRARLRQCQEKEIALSDCAPIDTASNDQSAAAPADQGQWSASNLDLQKQIQEQQLYIAKLRSQVSGMRRAMGGY
jgi:hypothetical protein